MTPPIQKRAKTAPSSPLPSVPKKHRKPFDWRLSIFIVWASGAFFILARLIAAAIGTRSLIYQASPEQDPSFCRLLLAHAREMGIKRRIRLLRTPRIIVPLTCGWMHPAILLPSGASCWPQKRKEIVLLHELAHIKRGDFLLSILCRIASILYWFNPLVWIALKKLAIERERASDDCVLLSGIKASEYASHLLEIAKKVSNMRWFSPAAITIAKKSDLEARIMSILNSKKPAGPIKFATLILAGLLAFSLLLPVASLKSWAQNEKYVESQQEKAKDTDKAQEGLSPLEKKELKRVLKEFFDYIENLDLSKAITFFDNLDIKPSEEIPLVIVKRGEDAEGKDIVILDVNGLKKVNVKTDVKTIVKKSQNVAVLGKISVIETDKENKSQILVKNDGQIFTLKKKDGKWKIMADGRLQIHLVKDDAKKESKKIGLAITDEGVTYTIIYVSPSITVVKKEKKKEEKEETK
jgi:beta-lactamase regulating signal transducer with metallopeptidase domain/ribosomal silencing factor RsfS